MGVDTGAPQELVLLMRPQSQTDITPLFCSQFSRLKHAMHVPEGANVHCSTVLTHIAPHFLAHSCVEAQLESKIKGSSKHVLSLIQ